MCNDDTSHQGLIAEVEHLEETNLKDFIFRNNNKNINFIALEDITDPENIGSIIRSAVVLKLMVL